MTVLQLAEQVMRRVTGVPQCSVLEAVSEIQKIITRRLLFLEDSRLEEILSVTFAADVSTGALPASFLGLKAKPYLLEDGTEQPLSPDYSINIDPGVPTCYQLLGESLIISPPPVDETVVWLPCFASKTEPGNLTDSLPFSGLYDVIFINGCTQMVVGGLLLSANKEFIFSLHEQIDVLSVRRDGNLPDQRGVRYF